VALTLVLVDVDLQLAGHGDHPLLLARDARARRSPMLIAGWQA
jgi:hypothetical protein